jgi:hypothetical protein
MWSGPDEYLRPARYNWGRIMESGYPGSPTNTYMTHSEKATPEHTMSLTRSHRSGA